MIELLTSEHAAAVQPLFSSEKYMGAGTAAFAYSKASYDVFCDTYLSNLNTFKAFGNVKDGVVTSFVSFHESIDAPEWYWTQVRSFDQRSISSVLDAVIKHNEERGRLKFFSLFNKKYVRGVRRFAFSEFNKERYDYFDEFIVQSKMKCFYTTPWQVLFNRSLVPVDAIMRCSFLKQSYRTTLPIAGNL